VLRGNSPESVLDQKKHWLPQPTRIIQCRAWIVSQYTIISSRGLNGFLIRDENTIWMFTTHDVNPSDASNTNNRPFGEQCDCHWKSNWGKTIRYEEQWWPMKRWDPSSEWSLVTFWKNQWFNINTIRDSVLLGLVETVRGERQSWSIVLASFGLAKTEP